MAEENSTNNQEEYVLTFKNGALEKLKELARRLDVPENDLDKVISKGLKVLELPTDDNKIIFKKGNDNYVVDLKRL